MAQGIRKRGKRGVGRRRCAMRPRFCLLPYALCLFSFVLPYATALPTHAQSLDDQLDEDQFLRGLVDYGLPEVLEHYLSLHPPTDPVDSLRYDIALKHMRVRDERLNESQRLRAIHDLLDARAKLLEQHADDPRHAIWLADQAADLYFVLLPVDAAGLTSFVGLPSDEQRDRAAFVAQEMYRTASLAEIEIEQAILDLESRPGYAGDIALQLQRRRLADEQRDRRIPFLLGIGAVLHARFNVNDVGEQRDLYALAAQKLTRVADLLNPPLANQARLFAAFAHTSLGEFVAAETLFERCDTDVDATPTDHFLVNIGRATVRAREAGPHESIALLHEMKQQYATRDTLFFRVLIADCEHLLLKSMADARSDHERARMLAASLEPYVDLLDVELGVPRETLRQIALTRLARGIDPAAPIDAMPALAAVAQAEMFARDDATRGKGIELYQQLLQRQDIAPADRAAALDGLGRALLADDQRRLAAETMLELATDHGSLPEAERAIELAVSIAAELHRESHADQNVADLLHRSLDLLLARYQNLDSIDEWRLLAVRLALHENRFADARAAIAHIPATSGAFPVAQFMRVQTTRTEAAAEADAVRRRSLAEQIITEADEVAPIIGNRAGRAASTTAPTSDTLLATLAVYRAEAELELGHADKALDAIKNLADDSTIERSLIAEATRLRIRAYYATNQPALVVREIERLTAAAPEEGGPMLMMLIESTQKSVERLRRAGRMEDSTTAAQRELVPLADALASWLASNANLSIDDRKAYLLRLAEAHRTSARFADALPLYLELVRLNPDGLEATLGQAECLFALGRDSNDTDKLADAMRIYRRIGAGEPDALGEPWWLAQLRMLQILDITGRNTQQIVPRILQLRQRDPALGGEHLKREFDTLQNRLR